MQNQKTEGIEIDLSAIEKLDELTKGQYNFVMGLIDPSMTDLEAYKFAYPNQTNMSTPSISVQICKLKAHPKISLIYQALRLQGIGQPLEDRQAHIERLRELSQQAQQTGNYGAAVNAEVNAGKVSGHYVDKIEIDDKREPELTDLAQSLVNKHIGVTKH